MAPFKLGAPLPFTVRAKPPLPIVPPRVSVPLSWIVVAAPSVRLPLYVFTPEAMLLMAPALLTPVPLIVIAGPLKVLVPVKLNCSSALLATVTPLEPLIAEMFPSCRMPAVTDVAPA